MIIPNFKTKTYKMKNRIITLLGLMTIVLSAFVSDGRTNTLKDKNSSLVFVGTYTDGGKSEGIYLYQMDNSTGALSFTGISAKTPNPSYLVIHPNKKWLFSVNELGSKEDKYIGTVSSFSIDLEKKQLNHINTVLSHGNYPCHISIDKSGKYVMVANYGNGSIAMYPINKDGSLSEASFVDQHRGKGPNAERQEGPHAHMITQGFDNRFVYNTDLGMDKIMIYKMDDTNGSLTLTNYDASAKPGAGPRHMAFHDNKNWLYVVNELNGTIEAFMIDKLNGALTRFQVISTLEAGDTRFPGSADIHISPNGQFLYATNRSEINTIAMFSIHPESGMLTMLGHRSVKGKTPRNFVIDPSGKFLLVANQNSNNIVTFQIDPVTALLKETGLETTVPSPVCLKFME